MNHLADMVWIGDVALAATAPLVFCLGLLALAGGAWLALRYLPRSQAISKNPESRTIEERYSRLFETVHAGVFFTTPQRTTDRLRPGLG